MEYTGQKKRDVTFTFLVNYDVIYDQILCFLQ